MTRCPITKGFPLRRSSVGLKTWGFQFSTFIVFRSVIHRKASGSTKPSSVGPALTADKADPRCYSFWFDNVFSSYWLSQYAELAGKPWNSRRRRRLACGCCISAPICSRHTPPPKTPWLLFAVSHPRLLAFRTNNGWQFATFCCQTACDRDDPCCFCSWKQCSGKNVGKGIHIPYSQSKETNQCALCRNIFFEKLKGSLNFVTWLP